MRKLIATTFLTLDGVMEAPGGEQTHPHAGWVGPFFDAEVGKYKLQETLDAESLLIGRVTYESFAGAWPKRDGEFAEKMNAMPKHVVSCTLKNPEWSNCSVIASNWAAEVRKLKAESGGPILVPGSRRLVHGLLAEHLIDELRLMIFPVILGSGQRLFPDSAEKITLRRTDSLLFPSGALVQVYAPAT